MHTIIRRLALPATFLQATLTANLYAADFQHSVELSQREIRSKFQFSEILPKTNRDMSQSSGFYQFYFSPVNFPHGPIHEADKFSPIHNLGLQQTERSIEQGTDQVIENEDSTTIIQGEYHFKGGYFAGVNYADTSADKDSDLIDSTTTAVEMGLFLSEKSRLSFELQQIKPKDQSSDSAFGLSYRKLSTIADTQYFSYELSMLRTRKSNEDDTTAFTGEISIYPTPQLSIGGLTRWTLNADAFRAEFTDDEQVIISDSSADELTVGLFSKWYYWKSFSVKALALNSRSEEKKNVTSKTRTSEFLVSTQFKF